jgi:hypothetical protein
MRKAMPIVPWVMSLSLAVVEVAQAEPAHVEAPRDPYPKMAPLEQYSSASQEEEIALARSSAPPSVANDADVLTLGARGYDLAVKGKNGFVCIVERAWANDFDNTDFWNPKVRSPTCFNAGAARSVLSTYLKRTEWVLSGVSKAEMVERTKAALANKQIVEPELGAMCYMMSKAGYLGDEAGGHWHPHVMFYLPRAFNAGAWGAELPGSPLFANTSSVEPMTVFLLPVGKWSDGTPDQHK